MDGLEWQRSKWGRFGRRYYLTAERLSVRWADALIADADGIREYYLRRYGAEAHLMAYGAPVLLERTSTRLAGLGLGTGGYHLAVARFEPENHLHLLIEGYRRSPARLPLVIVGSSPYNAPYARRLRKLAGDDTRIHFLGAVWDQDLLNELYANAATYFHGHSVGGTNPSLLRAMGAGAPVTAYDVVFNREVAADAGLFVTTADGVAEAVTEAEADPDATRARGRLGQRRVAERYQWDTVAGQYETLCMVLAAGGLRPRPRRCKGMRRGGAARP
jgi:glycosyltransferase involved in cell wall biosynthesis